MATPTRLTLYREDEQPAANTPELLEPFRKQKYTWNWTRGRPDPVLMKIKKRHNKRSWGSAAVKTVWQHRPAGSKWNLLTRGVNRPNRETRPRRCDVKEGAHVFSRAETSALAGIRWTWLQFDQREHWEGLRFTDLLRQRSAPLVLPRRCYWRRNDRMWTQVQDVDSSTGYGLKYRIWRLQRRCAVCEASPEQSLSTTNYQNKFDKDPVKPDQIYSRTSSSHAVRTLVAVIISSVPIP